LVTTTATTVLQPLHGHLVFAGVDPDGAYKEQFIKISIGVYT